MKTSAAGHSTVGHPNILCLWVSLCGSPVTKHHPLQGGIVRLQELSQSHFWGFSLGWGQSCPHEPLCAWRHSCYLLPKHRSSHWYFLRSSWARKHMSGFWFFPKSEVIPNHRACSTGETRTTAHSHKSFSNSFAAFATVGGGFLGSVRCWGWSQLLG